MITSRHRRTSPPQRSVSPGQLLGAGFGVWTMAAQFVDADQPRYGRVVGVALGIAMITAALAATRYRAAVAKLIAAAAVLLLALAGVVAGLSIDEAFTLVAGAIVLGLLSWVTWNPLSRVPKHALKH